MEVCALSWPIDCPPQRQGDVFFFLLDSERVRREQSLSWLPISLHSLPLDCRYCSCSKMQGSLLHHGTVGCSEGNKRE